METLPTAAHKDGAIAYKEISKRGHPINLKVGQKDRFLSKRTGETFSSYLEQLLTFLFNLQSHHRGYRFTKNALLTVRSRFTQESLERKKIWRLWLKPAALAKLIILINICSPNLSIGGPLRPTYNEFVEMLLDLDEMGLEAAERTSFIEQGDLANDSHFMQDAHRIESPEAEDSSSADESSSSSKQPCYRRISVHSLLIDSTETSPATSPKASSVFLHDNTLSEEAASSAIRLFFEVRVQIRLIERLGQGGESRGRDGRRRDSATAGHTLDSTLDSRDATPACGPHMTVACRSPIRPIRLSAVPRRHGGPGSPPATASATHGSRRPAWTGVLVGGSSQSFDLWAMGFCGLLRLCPNLFVLTNALLAIVLAHVPHAVFQKYSETNLPCGLVNRSTVTRHWRQTPLHLRCIILALGLAEFVDRSEHHNVIQYYIRARELVLETFDQPTIETVQTLVLLGCFSNHMGHVSVASRFFLTCLRVAELLGLDQLAECVVPYDHPHWIAEETKRRAWFNCVYFALSNGIPITLGDHITLDLIPPRLFPCAEYLWQGSRHGSHGPSSEKSPISPTELLQDALFFIKIGQESGPYGCLYQSGLHPDTESVSSNSSPASSPTACSLRFHPASSHHQAVLDQYKRWKAEKIVALRRWWDACPDWKKHNAPASIRPMLSPKAEIDILTVNIMLESTMSAIHFTDMMEEIWRDAPGESMQVCWKSIQTVYHLMMRIKEIDPSFSSWNKALLNPFLFGSFFTMLAVLRANPSLITAEVLYLYDVLPKSSPIWGDHPDLPAAATTDLVSSLHTQFSDIIYNRLTRLTPDMDPDLVNELTHRYRSQMGALASLALGPWVPREWL
ncbi:uncharacterized protein BJ171DRAFT_476888 [Polychytrium aggregatum]|uniref:uncharacterized protein n=1 Tax=Polychytrium aggregatum TaxID=110093 RepID=UPI0022FE1AF3|nr:uncharacterized protein BJ171DRAFT_476888 [Polychytrium aggregatum]KAI9202224.1 hypothetical protein BJ171DRAFT_476888 [Polychytrium aggregatum]